MLAAKRGGYLGVMGQGRANVKPTAVTIVATVLDTILLQKRTLHLESPQQAY